MMRMVESQCSLGWRDGAHSDARQIAFTADFGACYTLPAAIMADRSIPPRYGVSENEASSI